MVGVHLLLALGWVALGGPAWAGLLAGLAALALAPTVAGRRYVRSLARGALLLGVFFREIVVSSLRLARDLLRVRLPFRPAVVALEVPELGGTRTAALALLVSDTPGTLTLDTDESGRLLFVHSAYGAPPAGAPADLRALADRVGAATGREPRGRGRWS